MQIARNMLIGLVGVSMAASPVVAAPVERSSQGAEEVNDFGGTGLIFLIAAIAVAILAVVAFNDDDDPVSP